jgi:hypothetical protein
VIKLLTDFWRCQTRSAWTPHCAWAPQAIAAACPHLQLLLLGGSTIGAVPEGCGCQTAGDGETRDAAVAAVRSWTDAHADRCCQPTGARHANNKRVHTIRMSADDC